jgi:YgiT-type zinc finger domain-containing protein
MQEALTTFDTTIGDSVVIIHDVPGYVCQQCGETWYSGKVVAEIESMLNKIKESYVPEVFVGNFGFAATRKPKPASNSSIKLAA